jgi:hypothetical protein
VRFTIGGSSDAENPGQQDSTIELTRISAARFKKIYNNYVDYLTFKFSSPEAKIIRERTERIFKKIDKRIETLKKQTESDSQKRELKELREKKRALILLAKGEGMVGGPITGNLIDFFQQRKKGKEFWKLINSISI